MGRLSQLKIVLIGGGSVNWAPNIVRDMLLTPSLCNSEFVLLDIDQAAGDLTKAFLQKLATGLGAKARFESTTQPSALAGADYVLITISTGGLEAMAHDLRIPEKYSVFHTVGDTCGPGGWARTIRNFQVFDDLSKRINRYAPGAMVLNYSNPMTTLTDVLARRCQGPVIGLCHGLFENLEFIKGLYKLDREEDITLRYGGLNHFFWCTSVRARDIDVLADLKRRLPRGGFTRLLSHLRRDAAGFGSENREVATELFQVTGTMPYLGDRHTCEFFSCYLTDRRNLKKYKLVRTTIAQRRRMALRRRREIERLARTTPDPSYHQRTRETAADIIDAHVRGRSFIDVGNTPNRGQIANLPRGLVVETAVRVDGTGVTPLTFGELPELIAGFVQPHAQAFGMVVDACRHGNRSLAVQALRLDPLCAHLTGEQVRRLADELLGAHRSYIRCFG